MGKFRCVNCNYTFVPLKASEEPKRCPYCGQFNQLRKDDTANSILSQLD